MNDRRVEVAGIEEAQARWQVVRSKGRVKGIVALVVVLIVVFVIGLLGSSNSTVIAIIVIVVVAVIAVGAALIGKQRTGLSLTPEWKPEAPEDDYLDDDEDPDEDAHSPTDADVAGNEPTESDTEPVRRLDAQILGADLSKLGQVVSPKLAKSYAVGTLVLDGPELVWEPGAGSRATGIESLAIEPDQVSSVDAAPLWGSWALVRVASVGGDEWCMRVPGSVDLSPAFAELGLTLRKSV